MFIEETTHTNRIILASYMGIVAPPAVYRPSGFGSTDTLDLFNALTALLTLENHNGLVLQATPEAYKNARTMLENASSLINIPMPEFTPDGEGGIDIEWQRNGRHLALNFSGSGEGNFISWREPHARYEGAPAANEILIDKLDWLTR
jgi:hypothetical protein